MYRLKIRWKSAHFIVALIVSTMLILFLPGILPLITSSTSLIFDLPAAYVGPAQLLIPFLFAAFTYRLCPFVQQMRALLITCSIIGWFGLAANLNDLSAFKIIQEDWLVHFNVVALGIMNLAGVIVATALMQVEQMSSFADTKVAEAQLERLKAVKVDPETQAKWEKAAAYADRSTDGRSLRSTMTNLKAISLTEPGQELKPMARESEAKERQPMIKAPGQQVAKASGDEGSLANMLNRMDDLPTGGESEQLSAIKRDPALSGNSFINDVTEAESADTGGSFLDSILDAKLKEEEDVTRPSAFVAGLDLPAEEAEVADVAALLNQFGDDDTEGVNLLSDADTTAAAMSEPEPVAAAGHEAEPTAAALFEAAPAVPEDRFEASPTTTKQAEQIALDDAPETTRSSSFASASSSRNALPALAPLGEGAGQQVNALSGGDSANSAAANSAGTLSPTPASAPPTNTNNKLAAMKRRNTSTFTKLNALSASGTGSLKASPADADEPDSLRSLLDRLDDDQPAEEAAPKVEELARPLEPPVELSIDTVFKDDEAPEVAATPTTFAQPKAAGVAAKAEAAPVAKVAEPEPVAAVVDEPTATVSEPLFEAAAESEAAPLASLLDRTLGDVGYEYSLDQAPAIDSSSLAPAEEAEAEEPREPVFEQGVDSDIDNIFLDLAPPEAQLEVGQTEPATRTAASFVPAAEAEGGEVDNIFADHAPAAAEQDLVEPSEASTTSSISQTGDLSADLASLTDSGEEENGEAPSSLFDGGLDSEIDDIFSELAPPEAQKEVKDVMPSAASMETASNPAAAAPKAESFTPVPAGAASALDQVAVEAKGDEEEAAAGDESGLFDDSLDQELDSVFSGLTEGPQLEVTPSTLARYKGDEVVKPAAAATPAAAAAAAKTPVASPAEAASTAASAKAEPSKYKEVKEFGRLSARPTAAAKFGGETAGTMKTIGKLLLDVQAVENIIKSGENRKIGANLSTAKIISAARGEGIKNILVAIDTYEGVAGSLIVGHDGLVIASTVGNNWDKDMLGALSTALLSTSNLATKKLEIGKLRQMVMITELANGDGQQFKTTVLTDVDVGILAVFLEKTDLNKIDGLLDTIQTTIHGG